jgi:hypothetical protein
MCGTFDRYGIKEKCIQGFVWGNPRERVQLQDLDIDGRIIL